MLMGGITGSITYNGKFENYLPLLDFCSKTHIGKQTAFGLGKFHYEVTP
jgi:CRISPR/Cas system endoribonuclease Cas6 (RAMP superfamily)